MVGAFFIPKIIVIEVKEIEKMTKSRMDKIKYTCLTKGVLRDKYGRVGICMKNICGDNSLCGAHGNKKCPHKVKRNLVKENTND